MKLLTNQQVLKFLRNMKQYGIEEAIHILKEE